MVLLQIRSTLLGPVLSSTATLLFNRPVRGLLSKFSKPLLLFGNNERNHTALIERQPHVNIEIDTQENFPFLPPGSTLAVQHHDGGLQIHGTIAGHGYYKSSRQKLQNMSNKDGPHHNQD